MQTKIKPLFEHSATDVSGPDIWNLAPRPGLELFPSGEQPSALSWGEEIELGIKAGVQLSNFVQ
jgi:hypothetical protein